jgi:Cytochrome c7 and related cytochrome c
MDKHSPRRIQKGALSCFQSAGKSTLLSAESSTVRRVVIVVVSLGLSLLPKPIGTPAVSGETQKRQPQNRIQRSRKPTPDYKQFSHTTHLTQQKLTCDSCHKFPTKNWNEVRKGEAAFPDVADFPEHTSCLNCHRAQFFARERPAPTICSNCHINVTPRDTARFVFPSLADVSTAAGQRRDSPGEFIMNFPHDKHMDAVGQNLRGRALNVRFTRVAWREQAQSTEPKSCPVCHQTYQPQGKSDEEYVTKPPTDLGDKFWLKKGTFKTVPNSHAVCFTCHNVDVGIPPAPSDCNQCHKLAPAGTTLKSDFDDTLVQTMKIADHTILQLWRRRISSGVYRHEGGEHPNLSCLNCHSVATFNKADPKTLKVPVSSCGGAEGCHVTATADEGGILNYEIDQKKTDASFVCTKCHVVLGKEPLPETHTKAIQALTKKP